MEQSSDNNLNLDDMSQISSAMSKDEFMKSNSKFLSLIQT